MAPITTSDYQRRKMTGLSREEPLRRWKPSWLNYWQSFAASAVVLAFVLSRALDLTTAVGLGLCAIIIQRVILLRLGTTYYLASSGYLRAQRGIIAKYTDEIRAQDIRLINVGQGMVQRVFGIGDVALSTAGHAGVELLIEGVKDPEAVKAMIRRFHDSVSSEC